MDAQANSHQNGSGKLNVIFHGSYAFDQTTEPGRILAMMPEMPHHVYRAGNWLAEPELRGNAADTVVYGLSGVKPGADRFKPDDHLNLMVKRQEPAKPGAAAYATLRLPLPEKITSLLVADLPRSAFKDPEDLVSDDDPQHIATVQVFTYEIEDENTLALKAQVGDGHYWEPVFIGNYVNLHIFAAEDHYHKPSNAKEDFNECVSLLGGVKLRLETKSLPSSKVLDARQLPEGVVAAETESLALRTQRMARLGRLVSQNGDANLAWYGNDALDGDMEACSGPCF